VDKEVYKTISWLRAGRAIFVTEMDLLASGFPKRRLKTLLSLWEAHKVQETANTNRCREIRSNLSFRTMPGEDTNERFLVGFRDYQRPGVAPTPSNVAELFIDGFANRRLRRILSPITTRWIPGDRSKI